MKIINEKFILENIFEQLTSEEKTVVCTYFSRIENNSSITGIQQEMIEKIIEKYRPEIYESND